MIKVKTKKSRSLKSERALAFRLKGKVQPASGALPVKSLKGDVKTEQWLFDDKVTQAKSYSLKVDDFRKLRLQAFRCHRKAAMHITFDCGLNLVVMDEPTFKELNES